MHAIKRIGNKAIIIILTVAVSVSLLFGAFAFSYRAAKADTEEFIDVQPTSLGLSNTQFDSSSGSYPASPSSWTGAALDGGSGNVISGVIDLSANTYFGKNSGNEKFKLDRYPEYSDESAMPKTIFGADSRYENSDEKTLMINTVDGAEVAYAYTSGEMTFSPASFYRVSAWVKTGNFAQDTGATIKLNGLGQNCSFININTVRSLEKQNGIPVLTEANDYGWVKYTFYVRTSASLTKTVTLSLGIGDAAKGGDEDPAVMPRTADGYAFFDTVTAESISAHNFATETSHFVKTEKDNVYSNSTKTSIALDLNETKPFVFEDEEIGTFSNESENPMWKSNIYYDENSEDQSYAGVAQKIVYNSEINIPDLEADNNIYGFTANPRAPLGRAEYMDVGANPMFAGTNANILMISTYDGEEFQNAAFGVASPTVPIDRFSYYRFSVWVKGDSVEGGKGISILVKGKHGNDAVHKLAEYTNLTGDAEDAAHYGWKEQVVYIKGSMLFDYDVRFELWLGAPTDMSKGIAMFDNATFTKLTYSQFIDMSGADGGNVFNIDADPADTGIVNGTFSTVGDLSDEVEFPLPVAEWAFHTPDSVTASGFSKEEVDTANAVHGILPTDAAMFEKIQQSGAIPGITNPASMYLGLNRVLLLSSVTPTAMCYQSPALTLSTDKANRITVDMAVNGVTEGNGAALVLKTSEGAVISTIENIKTTNNAFKTFTFHIAAPLSEKTVNLEIWLGLNDRYDNTRKLSNGNVFVRQASITEWTAADENTTVAQEYAQILEKYKRDIASSNARKNLDYGVYSFSAPSLDYYDIYSYADDSGLGYPYQWSRSSSNSNVISGTFNVDDMKPNTVYDGFEKKDLSGNMLYIFNTDYNRTTYTYDNTITLVANMYYRIDIAVKVRVTDEIRKDDTTVGANLRLTGTKAEFTNIKDTTTLRAQYDEASRDYETFQTYSFYISTGANGGDIGLEISFGGNDRTSLIQGKLVIGNITMTEIDNLDFENAQKETNARITAVTLSEEEKPDDDTNTEAQSSEIQWWIIPTVIFSAALIAVIIIIIVVRVRDRIKRKKKVVYSSEYDRSDVMRDIERLQEQQAKDDKASSKKALPKIAPDQDDEDDSLSETEVSDSATETETVETTGSDVTDEKAQPEDDNDQEQEKVVDDKADELDD